MQGCLRRATSDLSTDLGSATCAKGFRHKHTKFKRTERVGKANPSVQQPDTVKTRGENIQNRPDASKRERERKKRNGHLMNYSSFALYLKFNIKGGSLAGLSPSSCTYTHLKLQVCIFVIIGLDRLLTLAENRKAALDYGTRKCFCLTSSD